MNTPRKGTVGLKKNSEKDSLESAISSSSGFANPYGEEDYPEDAPIETLSEDDEEFDLGLQERDQKKKAIRH